jgi:lipopolysaccharide biosynthesis regulator YciM
LFRDAIRYVKKGLKRKDLSHEKKIALQYEMAITYKMKGNVRKARKLFRSIHDADSGFREVKRELAEVS